MADKIEQIQILFTKRNVKKRGPTSSDQFNDTIEEIAGTKIRSIQKQVLLAPQVYDEVMKVAKEIANNVGASLVVAQIFEGTHKGHPYDVLQQIAKERNHIVIRTHGR